MSRLRVLVQNTACVIVAQNVLYKLGTVYVHLSVILHSIITHSLIGTLIFVDRDIGAHLVLQGGLRALVFAMSANVGSKLIQIMCLQMLQELARDAENLCVMAAENVINPLKQCKDKYKDDAKVSRVVGMVFNGPVWRRIMYSYRVV